MTREEAIKEIKSWDFLKGKEIEVIQTLIPELSESEDERMVRAIEHILYENYSDAAIIEGVEIAEIVAWLEKQKEQKPVKYGDDVVEEAEEYTSKVDCGEYGAEVTEAYIAGVLAERNRKPAEWSEEDKEILLSIINAFRNGTVSTIGEEQWLKSLPKRLNLEPKQEWSEKDEDNLHRVIRVLEDNDSDWKELSDWLKSLRPQPHWKPSEEQMEALDEYIYAKNPNTEKYSKAVLSLRDELKKLM